MVRGGIDEWFEDHWYRSIRGVVARTVQFKDFMKDVLDFMILKISILKKATYYCLILFKNQKTIQQHEQWMIFLK